MTPSVDYDLCFGVPLNPPSDLRSSSYNILSTHQESSFSFNPYVFPGVGF